MSKGIEIITLAEAAPEHPRSSEASMVELKDGHILLAWMEFSRSAYGAGDEAPSNICTITSNDGGRTWGDYRVLLEMAPGDTSLYCPNLLRLTSGEILLAYDRYHLYRKGEDFCASGFASKSFDEGRSFTDPVLIWDRTSHASASGTLKQLSTGRLVFPVMRMSGKTLENDDAAISPTNHVIAGCFYSDDNGETWTECESYVDLPLRGAMEPKVEELNDGRALMVLRTQLGSVFKSVSEDGGQNWAKAQTAGLRAPESCPELLRIPQTGDLMVVWNDSPYDPQFDHYGKRTPLAVALSKDEGATWENVRYIEDDPTREFTNPAAVVTSRGTVILTYCTSVYKDLTPPGRLGRDLIDLRAAIIDIDWFCE